MRSRKLTYVSLVAAFALAGTIATGSAASAADAAEDSDLTVHGQTDSISTRPLAGPIKSCSTSKWRYDSTSRAADKLMQFGPTQANRNRTGATANTTFTSQIGGTVTASFSGSTNVKGTVKIAEISGTFGVSASLSLTASLGNSTTIKVPTGKTGYGAYGVWQVVVKGKEIRTLAPACALQSRAANVRAPFRVGWDTWVR